MKTILVDDMLLDLQLFELKCADMPDFEIVGKFTDPNAAIEYAAGHVVDFALLDIDMPGMDGIHLAQALRRLRSDIIIVFATAHPKFAVEALKMKADYIIFKPFDREDIADVMERAKLLRRRQCKRIHFHTFGAFDMLVDGEPVHFRSGKAKELMALCVYRDGRPVSIHEIVENLWGENADGTGYRRTIKELAERTADRGGFGCAKLVVFCNAVEDNPFMAGAFHGVGEPERVINVGVSGPGVVYHALQSVKGQPFDVVAETIKKTAFRITRMGQLVAQEASRRLDTPFGIVDLSLAPTPAVGDSVARILEEMGLEVCGTHGTTAALALLNDAVKKGGVMASSSVGGLSGAFIPVSEDEGMIAAASSGALTLDKLEAMTCVCSVGLDMIAVPGDTTAETISAIIADEAAIGMVNSKTPAVRLIPAPGKQVGDTVEFGGLLGSAPVQPVHPFSAKAFVDRGGRIPAPMQSLKN